MRPAWMPRRHQATVTQGNSGLSCCVCSMPALSEELCMHLLTRDLTSPVTWTGWSPVYG